MPLIKAAGERAMIPQGEHILTLQGVKAHISDDPWHPVENPETGEQEPSKKEQLIWQFESATEQPDGRPYEFATFTGLFYGDPRANLTALLDMLMPNSDDATKKRLDTDTLVGMRFKARIQHVKNQKGKLVPKALYYEPIKDVPM